jgi:DNA primase
MLYGTVEEEFEDMVLKENDKGELVLEPELQKAKVFEKIFLDLQEDEIAFANEKFREHLHAGSLVISMNRGSLIWKNL